MLAQEAAAKPEPASQSADPTLGTLALGTISLVRKLIGDLLSLAALEARLAALSLIGIVAAALATAFAVMAFWLMLQATLLVGFLRLGADLLWLLAGFTVFNGLAVMLCLFFIRRLGGNLTFRATAAALRGSDMHAAAETRHSP